MDENPVLICLGGAALVIAAGLAASNALGWTHLEPGQLAAVIAFVVAFAGLLAAMIRGQVYSPATHDRDVATALHTPVPLETITGPPEIVVVDNTEQGAPE